MNKPIRVAWEGQGYYQRERDYQGSAENGISWVGYVWRKLPYYTAGAHRVSSETEIWHEIEPRYHSGYDGSRQS